MNSVNQKIAAVFPGQGVQHSLPGMAERLLESDPYSEETFRQASRFLGRDILKLCLEGPPEKLGQSHNLQPAVAVASVAAYESLRRLGFRPDVVAGHSLGEYPALVAAEAITLESMCRLVQARSIFMEEANNAQPGGMTAVLRYSLANIRRLTKEHGLDVAVHNVLEKNKENIVVAGSDAARKAFNAGLAKLKESDAMAAAMRAVHTVDLDIPYPAHSRGMRLARAKMVRFIPQIPFYDPLIPFVSNSTGNYALSGAEIKASLPKMLTQTVKWHETIKFMEDEGVVAIFEVGPGEVLTNTINKHLVTDRVELLSFDPTLEKYADYAFAVQA